MLLACVGSAEEPEPFLVQSSAELELARKKAAPPVLSVSPARLQVTADEGAPASARLVVENSGGQTLAWRVLSAPRWARVQPSNGALGFQARQTVTVSLSSEGLAPGVEEGALVIEAPGAAGSPASIPVAFEILKPAPSAPERASVPAPPREETRERAARARRPREEKLPPLPPLPALPPAPREEVPEGPAGPGGFGVRLSGLFKVSGDVSYSGVAPMLGVSYARDLGESGALAVELAAELGGATTVGAYESEPFAGSVSLLWRPGDAERLARPYVAAGGGTFVERVTESSSGSAYTNNSGFLSLGGGLLLGGRFDLRLTYELLPGSRNIDGLGRLAFGYLF